MRKPILGLAYAVTMVAVVVGADLEFFRNHWAERLLANVAIVSTFAAVYLGLGGRPWSPRK